MKPDVLQTKSFVMANDFIHRARLYYMHTNIQQCSSYDVHTVES